MNTERGENDGPEREGETSRDHPFWSRPYATLWSACVIAASALVMLALSWRKWGDPVVDFGTEIYIAWQLHEGAVFFRDVRHTYSPLSPYINAGWFTLFGVSYRSLIVGNAIVLTVLIVLMHRVLRRIASLPATTAALVFFVLVFAFGQYARIGNYNYLGPYAHEVTHGLTLAFLALFAFSRYAAERGRMALIACGLALGFVFLTKYEVFLAGTCAVLIGLITVWRADRRGRLGHLLCLIATIPVPLLLCWAWLSSQLPVGVALRASLGPYPLLLTGGLRAQTFFADVAGLSELAPMIRSLLLWSTIYGICLLLPLLFARMVPRLQPPLRRTAAFVLPFAIIGVFGEQLPWHQSLVPLPFLLLVGLGWQVVRGRERTERAHVTLALTVFALLLLARTPFYARVHHFGFALAMPGTLLLIVTLLDVPPGRLGRIGQDGSLFRVAAGGLLVAFCAVHISLAARYFALRTTRLGDGADTMLVDRRGATVNEAVAVVRDRLKPEETLVVLPEGVIVNYLARRRSPVPFVLFIPFSLWTYGEANIVAELNTNPPGYVLAFPKEIRDLEEFGCVVFGSDCARSLGDFVHQNYAASVIGMSDGRRVFTLFGKPKPGPSEPPSVFSFR